ncbi:MAG: hypothetical protein A2W93_00650 [Bacteroidetes bacterium GWF2_43_63]|nr:MAG: hypothetical protein A2W93_00650 [Bacteroidetes bacterium GWF2_43_63]
MPGIVKAQQLVTWTNNVNTTVSNNILTKTSGTNGWDAGAESQNMLAFGQDGWVEFKLQEVTKTKAIGISYEPSTGVLKDSIKYGFVFSFSDSTRVLETKKLNTTSNKGTYNLNDVFRIEKVDSTIFFLKNGVKLDSASMTSNDKSFFIDASISTLGGQFHSVRTSFSLLSSLTINPDKDAIVSSLNAAGNYGNYAVFIACQQTNSGVANTLRGLMEFDVSSIPRNAKIVYSKLFLYSRDPATYAGHRCDTYCNGNSASLLANDSTWTESTVTWNTKPRYDANTYFTIPNLGYGYCYYIDVVVESRNVVQKWVDGTKINYGVTFKVNNEIRYTTQQYKSTDDANTSERPRMEVKYYIGTKYYVNDNSTVQDVFCKVAGSSANTGLSPYSPLNRVDSVLKKYVLGALDTIFVDAGTYSEAITVSYSDRGSINGQMVIHGAGNNLTTFNFSTNHNLYLNNADYVTIENLSLKNIQTNSYYNVYNYGSQNMVLRNDSMTSIGNNIYLTGSNSVRMWEGTIGFPLNSEISNCDVLGKAAGKTNFKVAGSCTGLLISDNSFTNEFNNSVGLQLVYLYELNNYYSPLNVTIRNNIFNIDSIGILATGVSSSMINSLRIKNNRIILGSSGSTTYGMFFNYSGSSSSYIDTISGNTIIGGGYGIKASYLKYAKVYNNYLVNNTNGISLTSSQDNLFAYNNFKNPQSNFIGTTSDVPTNTTLSNNIFVSTGNTSYNLSLAAGIFASCDYNCYYGPNNAGVAVHNGLKYPTLTSWKGIDHYTGTGNGDEHSISADPLYPDPVTDDLDIDLFSPCTQAGSGVSGINTDIYNRVRRSLPSIGANEPILFLNFPVLKNSVLTDEDTVIATLTGSGIDTTFVVPDTFLVYPSVPLEGYLNYEISFEGDTALIDDSSIGFRVNSLGIIDSVYEKRGASQYPLDPTYYTLFNLNRAIAASAIMKIIPYFAVLSEKPDGGFINTPGRRLRFYYQEEYNVQPEKNLEYKIYNSQMGVVASVSHDGIKTPTNSPSQEIKSGQNRIVLTLASLGLASQQYYLLEVINEKGEKWYLRFRY